MKCNECQETAKINCECGLKFCETNALPHSLDFGHRIQRISRDKNEDKKDLSEILSRINEIHTIKNKIISGSAELIRLIKNLTQNHLEKLLMIKARYLQNLERNNEIYEKHTFIVPNLEEAKLSIENAYEEYSELSFNSLENAKRS